MNAESVLRLHQVTKTYAGSPAVEALSLSLAPRTILVLLGASGCGKTTTLRLIAGLEQPESGEVWLNGRQVAGGSVWVAPERRQIGMVFQDYALFPHLTVGDNIAFALKGMKEAPRRQRTAEMLTLVGLSAKAARYPHELSGGEQQRVALARALAAAPTLVLLDEPFSNLDAVLRRTMREEVLHILRTAGAAAIFVTHDQEEALRMADQIAIMQRGRIVQVGSPDAVYNTPVSLDTACFLGDANILPGQAHGQTVETLLGTLPLAAPAFGAVQVMIRPEALTLSADPQGSAVIESSRYYGHDRSVLLRHNSGMTLEARVWGHAGLAAGDRVRVEVQALAVAFAGGQ